LAALWAARIDTLRAVADGVSTDEKHSSLLSPSPHSPRTPQGPFELTPSPRFPMSPLLTPLSRAPMSPLWGRTMSGPFVDRDRALSWTFTGCGSGDFCSPFDNQEHGLPLAVFMVAETPLKVVLENIARCLCLLGNDIHISEVTSAGMAVLSQVVRGAGAAQALSVCPGLPEALFAAVDGKALGARQILEQLARIDGTARLGYWVRLCRAVFSRAEFVTESPLTHTDTPRELHWLARCHTRAVAVAVARIAAEAAYFSGGRHSPHPHATNSRVSKRVSASVWNNIDAAIGDTKEDLRVLRECVPDLLSLASSACMGVSSSADAASEGCKLLQFLIESFAGVVDGDDTEKGVLNRHMPGISAALRLAMSESCPAHVVESALSATAGVLAPRQDVARALDPPFDLSLFGVFIGQGRPFELHVRYRYERFSDTVGMNAILSGLSQIAHVVAASQSLAVNDPLRSALFPHLSVLRRLFIAVVADFASVLSDGTDELLKGALAVYSLKSSLMTHIAPIAFGAASLCGCWNSRRELEECESEEMKIPWHNAQSPGAMLVDSGDILQQDLVAMSVCVWLIGQQHSLRSKSASSPLPWLGLASEGGRPVPVARAFSRLLLNPDLPMAARVEALCALNDVDGSAAVSVCESIALAMVTSQASTGDDDKTADPAAVMSLLATQAFEICIEQILTNTSGVPVGNAFHAASALIGLAGALDDQILCAHQVLDAFIFVMNLPPAMRLRQMGRKSVQARVSHAIAKCMRLVDQWTCSSVLAKVGKVILRMQKLGLSERLSLLTAVGACVGGEHPVTAGQQVAKFLSIGDGVVDAMLVCSEGPAFMLSCMLADGSVCRGTEPADVARLLSAVLRRIGLGRGEPRHAAARLLVTFYERSAAGPVRELVLSALLPILARDAGKGEFDVVASATLARLSELDFEAFRFHLCRQNTEVRKLLESRLASQSICTN
jgi:hypothetical protein